MWPVFSSTTHRSARPCVCKASDCKNEGAHYRDFDGRQQSGYYCQECSSSMDQAYEGKLVFSIMLAA